MFRVLALVTIVCASAFVACDLDTQSEKIEFSQFVGIYKADFGSAQIDLIEFRADSMYVHVFQVQGGEPMEDSGKYEFLELTPGRNDYRVRFEQFVIFANEALCSGDRELSFGGKRAEWRSLAVTRSRFEQRIELCHNQRRDYVKVK
jgi:hypothetical protein